MTDPHVTFTSATTETGAVYVFAGNSMFGPTISNSAPSQTLDASDLWSGVGGALVGAGASVGLGHVFDALANGSITISSVPEPSALTFTLLGLAALTWTRRLGSAIALP